MPDPLSVLGGGMAPAGVPPEDYANYLQAARKAQLAQALMQSSLSPLQQPQVGGSVRGLYVQPRTGALSAASKIAEALTARKVGQDSVTTEANLASALNQAYAPGGQPMPADGSAPPAGAPTGDPNAPPAGPPPPPRFTPANPRNPYGLPADVVRNLAMSDPKTYAAMLQGPEAVQLARLAGVDPRAAAAGALTKSTALEVRPGGTVIDPISGATMVGADPSKGEFYAVGPDGQVHAFPITNDATIQAWREGLTTGAKEANTPRDIPSGGGKTTLGYPPLPPFLQGTGAPGGAGGAPRGPITTLPPNGNAPPAGGPAPTPGAIPPPPKPQGPPSAAAAPPAATPGVGAPDAHFFSTMPKMVIPNTPGQTSDTYTTGLLNNAAAKAQKLTDQYGEDARNANQQLQYNAEARAALPNAELGPMSDFLTHNRAALIEAGFPAALIPGSGTVTPTMEVNKALKNAALQGAKQTYGPRMTQTEVKLQTDEMSPGTKMMGEAVGSLLNQSDVRNNYLKQRGADYQRYIAAHGDPNQFEAWYENGRPLTRFAAQSATPAAALQRLQKNPALLPDFKAKYGWDPTQ